ncbi:MAG: regulator of amino acid metabolism, contains ACT domain protein [Methanomicrobiales archaeon]|nr:regulator of amino acid metabolism, contains ACT domain protein [Methanomicrobiales archaeon]
MWAEIMGRFADSPAQARVVRFLLENGFGVSARGRVTCNGVEIPSTHVGKATGTDRRVVDTTVKRILEDRVLSKIFINMRVTPDLSQVADSLGLTVLTILPRDASEKGIIGAAVGVLHDHDLNIRQIFVTDPYFSEQPKLVIILDGPLPVGVVEEIRALPQIRSVML